MEWQLLKKSLLIQSNLGEVDGIDRWVWVGLDNKRGWWGPNKSLKNSDVTLRVQPNYSTTLNTGAFWIEIEEQSRPFEGPRGFRGRDQEKKPCREHLDEGQKWKFLVEEAKFFLVESRFDLKIPRVFGGIRGDRENLKSHLKLVKIPRRKNKNRGYK